MSDKTAGSVNDRQQNNGQKNRSVLDKAINAVAEAFKNGSAETTMAHWPDIAADTGRPPSESRDSGDGKGESDDTVVYTFRPVEKLEKNGKKNKKKKKKDKKKQKKLEKKLAEKLKKKEKKARKKLKKEGKQPDRGLVDKTEHSFNEAGPYGPGGL